MEDSTLIGSIIIVVLFIIERYLNHRNDIYVTNQNWYIEVLVRPNLDLIKDHFKNFHSSYEMNISDLKNLQESNIEDSRVLSFKANKFSDIKEMNKHFTHSFLVPIKPRYTMTYYFLAKKIERLEDEYITGLDNVSAETDLEEHLNNFEEKISRLKGKFYTNLYNPIKKEQFSWENIFKRKK